MFQTRRHGRAYQGRAPPTDCLCPPERKLCPPKRGLCPEEINWLGAFRAQTEAQIGAFYGLTPDFRMKTFFFVEITCFWRENPLEIPISAGKSLEISVKTFLFFLELTCFRPEKPFEFLLLTLFI